ncbi:MAG: PIN domain-containing protein, partial [Myxococcota bacterium]|nr:PIN domain-containing protein [Myxococcota bacterium]
ILQVALHRRPGPKLCHQLLRSYPDPSAPQPPPNLDTKLRNLPCLPLRSPDDYVDAARIFRRCRRDGLTVRGTIDCLIAALALRVRAEVLHRDRGFDAIRRAYPALRVTAVPAAPGGAGGGS